VAKFHLTNLAATDLSDIADFTIQNFGIEQARFYRDGFNNCFEILAENPQLGRSAADLAPNLRRYEHQAHVVFYLPEDTGILIVRILHQRMDFKRHLSTSIKE
jgi:toxin ParE1/3/4